MLIGRWQLLTDKILPDLAQHHHWPISANHCFKRVCLDANFGVPWHEYVNKPATRHMTDTQLKHAIATAEQVIETPALLFELNTRSIQLRRAMHEQS